MRKSGLSSGFLKLGCYCSRILIHILSFSNTRLQQQAMARVTKCSKILIRILSFSNTRLQQQSMVGITQRSKILIRILPFCNTRLQQQTVAWITHGNLSDQFFALTRCMSTSWLSKAMFTLYRIVKRSVTETEWYSVNRP